MRTPYKTRYNRDYIIPVFSVTAKKDGPLSGKMMVGHVYISFEVYGKETYPCSDKGYQGDESEKYLDAATLAV
jgi:hypothetical protein